MIDQNFLSDQENMAGGCESIVIEGSVFFSELHQVDRGQIACGVIQEHVYRTWVARVYDPTTIGQGPLVDGRVVLNPWNRRRNAMAQSDIRLRISFAW